MKNLKIKKWDAVIIVAFSLLCILLFAKAFFKSTKPPIAKIYANGELKHEIDLSNTKQQELKIGNCTVKLEKGAISIISSTCKDKLCVKTGKLKKPGDCTCCAPNKVAVVVEAKVKDEFDAIAY